MLLETAVVVSAVLVPYQGNTVPATKALAMSIWLAMPSLASPTVFGSSWLTCTTKPGWVESTPVVATDWLASATAYDSTVNGQVLLWVPVLSDQTSVAVCADPEANGVLRKSRSTVVTNQIGRAS